MDNMDKIFFAPGDIVTIKHKLGDKPIMLVKGKETKTILDKTTSSTHFKGIKCFWFTKDNVYQEQVFSTKDLCHVDNK